MKLSDGEKIILIMLADLHKHLKVEGEIDPDFVSETIYGDKLWGFHWKFSGLPLSEEAEPQEVSETVDILEMYSLIGAHFRDLPAPEQERVLKETNITDMTFPGFDGNNDPHKGVARYLVKQLERFTDLKGATNNSHSRGSLPRYLRMLAIYLPMRDELGSGRLTADQIIKIFTAR
ncbi:YfbU family protein [Bradyrhizobium sp. SZCCHNS3053]|uniref:YfbU family protein n=1 Tax=Bradyrhizobium sp. SZCCHNS3053 TaxID=3057322 RepID=UPI00291675B4|nr:YfbU family protein [Bradyrhizobium sp. SZCCHNS3053]